MLYASMHPEGTPAAFVIRGKHLVLGFHSFAMNVSCIFFLFSRFYGA